MAKQWIDDLMAAGVSPTAAVELLKFIDISPKSFCRKFVWYALDSLAFLLPNAF